MLQMLDPLAHPHRFAAALCLLVLVRGIALMCILPPGEGWDEYQHVAYVHEIAAGRDTPVLGETTVDPAVIAAAVELPMSNAAAGQLQKYGAVTYQEYWQAVYRQPEINADPLPLYQAQHAPLWYHIAAPIYEWTGGPTRWRESVAALRATNLLLLCVTTLLAIATVRMLWPTGTALLVTIAVALSPMMLLNAVRAANDSLAMTLAAACGLCVALTIRAPNLWWPIAAGLLAAVGFWAKTSNIALLPFGVLAIALCGNTSWPKRWISAALFAMLGLYAAAPYMVQSYHEYGVLIPAQESVHLRQSGEGIAAQVRASLEVDWPGELRSWWTRGTLWVGGWSFMRPAKVWRTIYELLLAGGVIGWVISLSTAKLRIRGEKVVSWRVGIFCLLLWFTFTAALAAHAIQSKAAWGEVTTNPWYASAAIPMLLMLVASGYARVLGARAAAAAMAAMAVLYLVVEVIAMAWHMPRSYTMEPLWSGGMWRLASLQRALLGKYTLAAALLCELALLALIARAIYRVRLSMCQKET